MLERNGMPLYGDLGRTVRACLLLYYAAKYIPVCSNEVLNHAEDSHQKLLFKGGAARQHLCQFRPPNTATARLVFIKKFICGTP